MEGQIERDSVECLEYDDEFCSDGDDDGRPLARWLHFGRRDPPPPPPPWHSARDDDDDEQLLVEGKKKKKLHLTRFTYIITLSVIIPSSIYFHIEYKRTSYMIPQQMTCMRMHFIMQCIH